MKKIISLILICSMIFVPSIANAISSEDLYTKENQGKIDDVANNNKILEERNKSLEEFMSKKITRGVITDTRSGWLVDYPVYKQDNSYYCGPATMKQAIQYLTGKSSSQATYASNMQTTKEKGTYVYKMTQEINKRQTKFKYAYKKMGKNDMDITWNAIVQNVLNDKPTILHANTASLYLYNGKSLGHYITAVGYYGLDFADNDKEVDYVDTYSKDYGRGTTLGLKSDSKANVTATVNGRYIIY